MAVLGWLKDKRVGIRAAWIGGLFVLVAAIVVATLPLVFRPRPASAGKLGIVAVTVHERDFFPVVDIKLRNTSSEPAFLTSVELLTEDASLAIAGPHHDGGAV